MSRDTANHGPLSRTPRSRAARTPQEALDRLRAEALRLGFLRLGVAAAGPAETHDAYRRFLAEGRHGTMAFLSEGEVDRADVRRFLPGARSVVVATAIHSSDSPPHPGEPAALVARYARGKDYHKGLRRSFIALARLSDRLAPGSTSRIFLDTTPVLEREWAARAGLGWIGKNGCLIDETYGSWLLIGGFVTTADLPPATERVADGCGECRRCLDGCPTRAFVAERTLDARLCLSYTTIEHRGPLGGERLASIGERVFGCDVCQEVCPWNATPEALAAVPHPALRAREGAAFYPLSEAAELDRSRFDERFAGTPVRRPGFAGFARSVLAAIAATGDRRLLPSVDALEGRAEGDEGILEAARFARNRLE